MARLTVMNMKSMATESEIICYRARLLFKSQNAITYAEDGEKSMRTAGQGGLRLTRERKANFSAVLRAYN